MNREEFVETIKPLVMKDCKSKNLPVSLCLAQVCLESNFGQSALSQSPNFNLCGIKGTGTAGSVSFPTTEYINGKATIVNDYFRKYNSWQESISDHNSLFLRLSRYHNLIGEKDYKVACVNVRLDGYATDPAYTTKLIGLIENYGWQQLDGMSESERINEWMYLRGLVISDSVGLGTKNWAQQMANDLNMDLNIDIQNEIAYLKSLLSNESTSTWARGQAQNYGFYI